MKPLIPFMMALFLLVPGNQALAEYLQGTVVSVDRDKGEVEIILSNEGMCRFQNGPQMDEPGAGQHIEPKEQRRVLVKTEWFPRCLEEGRQVYARGEFVPERTDLFEAEDIFPCRRHGGHDPTGVRNRFRHHRQQMKKHMGREMHD